MATQVLTYWEDEYKWWPRKVKQIFQQNSIRYFVRIKLHKIISRNNLHAYPGNVEGRSFEIICYCRIKVAQSFLRPKFVIGSLKSGDDVFGWFSPVVVKVSKWLDAQCIFPTLRYCLIWGKPWEYPKTCTVFVHFYTRISKLCVDFGLSESFFSDGIIYWKLL